MSGLADVVLNKTASQSSNYASTTRASLAVDGNTDGNFNDGLVTLSNADANAWWQVDLGGSYAISQIAVWNRTDCCVTRLSNFYVLVSSTPFSSTNLSTTLSQPDVTAYFVSGQADLPTRLTINLAGRYVRVQLTTTTYLGLAEVQVFGS